MSLDENRATDSSILEQDIERAWRARAELHAQAEGPDATQNAYRVFHGYHDGLPGLNVDRFGTSCIVGLKTNLLPRLEEIHDRIAAIHGFERIVLRTQKRYNRDPRPLAIRALSGDLPEEPIEVLDNGLTYAIDLSSATNPGLFLDARPARRWLLDNSRGRRVLNLFAFTGSLGLSAAKGGAACVTHVDADQAALAAAQANHARNGLPIEDRDLLRGDLYYHLPRAAKAGKTFDGIILDPPPQLPKSKRRRPRGQDYPKLARLATELLPPGGWILCFFHRYDVSREEYEAQVTDSASCELQVLWRGTSGEDFPERDPDQKLRLTVFERPPRRG